MQIVKTHPVSKFPNFSERLRDACDRLPDCPALNHGRLGWLQKALLERGFLISVESIRKWLAGDMKPREDRIRMLADILQVDPVWLQMGDKRHPKNTNQSKVEIRAADDTAADEVALPISIRPGMIVRIFGLPLDLSPAEAKRIANIVMAHATSTDGAA